MHIAILPILVFILFSCESPSPSTQNTQVGKTNNLTLVPAKLSQDAATYPNAQMKAFAYKNNRFIFAIQGLFVGPKTEGAENIKLKKTSLGNHIHISLNNEQHFFSNFNEFNCPLKNGSYKMVAFLSRSYFESIKSSEAIIAKQVTVSNGHFKNTSSITDPYLVYHMPRGLYSITDTSAILLDYLLLNTELNKDNLLHVLINKEKSFFFTKQEPLLLKGLSVGKYTVQLEILDKNRKRKYPPVLDSFEIEK